MNWVYWLTDPNDVAAGAALVIFVYLVIALFKPEYFE